MVDSDNHILKHLNNSASYGVSEAISNCYVTRFCLHGISTEQILKITKQQIFNSVTNHLCMQYSCCPPCKLFMTGGAQITGARSFGHQNFVQYCLIFVGPQYGPYFMSLFWRKKICGSLWISGEFIIRCLDFQPAHCSAVSVS
jgi:hypothetical protein